MFVTRHCSVVLAPEKASAFSGREAVFVRAASRRAPLVGLPASAKAAERTPMMCANFRTRRIRKSIPRAGATTPANRTL